MTRKVIAGLVLVGSHGVYGAPERHVALGVVWVSLAAVVAGRRILRPLASVAQDVVGGALLVTGHGQLLPAGLPGRSRMDRRAAACGVILTHQVPTYCQAPDTLSVHRSTVEPATLRNIGSRRQRLPTRGGFSRRRR